MGWKRGGRSLHDNKQSCVLKRRKSQKRIGKVNENLLIVYCPCPIKMKAEEETFANKPATTA